MYVGLGHVRLCTAPCARALRSRHLRMHRTRHRQRKHRIRREYKRSHANGCPDRNTDSLTARGYRNRHLSQSSSWTSLLSWRGVSPVSPAVGDLKDEHGYECDGSTDSSLSQSSLAVYLISEYMASSKCASPVLMLWCGMEADM